MIKKQTAKNCFFISFCRCGILVMIYHPDLSKQRCSSQFNVLRLDCQDLRHEPEVVNTMERKSKTFESPYRNCVITES